MIEASGERYIEARSEQVWMLVDNTNCLARWLSFATQIEVVDGGEGVGTRQIVHGHYHRFCQCVEQEVTVYEPARLLAWTTEEHPVVSRAPRFDRSGVMTIELIPEGAGTRVRIESRREPAGPLRGLAMRITTQRAIERHIRQSLLQLENMLKGRQLL